MVDPRRPSMERAPEIGDVRIVSDGTGSGTRIQSWSGGAWTLLRGVSKLELVIDANNRSQCKLTLYPCEVWAVTPADQVRLAAYKPLAATLPPKDVPEGPPPRASMNP